MAKTLISNWQQAWRLHTVKLGAALMIIPELLWKSVEVLGAVLPAIPHEINNYLPPTVRAALAIAGLLVIIVRLWRQPSVDKYFENGR